MSLISGFVKDDMMPIYDNVEFAKGCENFLFRAKTESECWGMYNDFLNTVPNTKIVKAYRIGLRPDYPVPVSRYFIEICVDDPPNYPVISWWTRVDAGRLDA